MNLIYNMKRISTILTALLLLAVFSTAVRAQTSDQATVTATANVEANLTVENVIDLDFGNILAGSTKFLDSRNQSFNPSADGVSGGESFGVAKIDYVPGESINVEVSFPSQLVADGVSGDNTMSVDFSIDGASGGGSGANIRLIDDSTVPDGSDNQALTSVLNGGDNNNWGSSNNTYSVTSIQVPSGGTIYAVLGGDVNAGSDQAIGQYTGSISITVTLPN